MPIHVPGKRSRSGRRVSGKRSVVAVLSLTAMVDLFTVLVVFLLQNYATTGEVLDIPEGVVLPQAMAVKNLKPANVLIVSDKGVQVNNETVTDLATVRAAQDWMVEAVRKKVSELVEKGEQEKASFGKRIVKAVTKIQDSDDPAEPEIDEFRKMTIQADKEIDFLTLKKVMYTVTEAGIYEINFAVLKRPDQKL